MNPLVYIVMPVYNRDFSLIRSVTSILNQTYKNWELMIVDDNSTDKTPSLIKQLVNKNSNISTKLNTEFSHSAAGARLSGLIEKKGKYVAFLDSDDEWPDYHLEHFVNALEADETIDFIFGDIQRINENNEIITKSKFIDENGLPEEFNIDWNNNIGILNDSTIIQKSIKYRFNTGFHTALFVNGFLDKVPMRDIGVGEDHLFTLEALVSGAKIAVSKDIHLFYSIHQQNISSVNAKENYGKALQNCLDEILLLKKTVPTYIQLSQQEKKSLKTRIAELYVWHLANAIYRENGKRREALLAISNGIRLDPINMKYWKTFIANLMT